MARFLSPEWFEEVARATPDPDGPGNLVIEQVVRDTPEGEVRYRVLVAAGSARIEAGSTPAQPADLTITCDWTTATAMAKGQLSAQKALMDGLLRVRGNLARLSARADDLVGLDPVPAAVRRQTTY